MGTKHDGHVHKYGTTMFGDIFVYVSKPDDTIIFVLITSTKYMVTGAVYMYPIAK